MARVPLTAPQVNAGKLVLNAESVGISPEQFYRLCRDNPDLRIEFTARKEIEIMAPTYRPGRYPERLDQPQSVSGDPELPGFKLDLTEIWK